MWNLVGHLAFILIAASFLVRDILWLRAISIVASAIGISYYFGNAEPLWLIIFWNAVFASINGAQISLLLAERSGIQLDDNEAELYETIFRILGQKLGRQEVTDLISNAGLLKQFNATSA